MRKQQPEYELQKAVCQYLELQYPDVLFVSTGIPFNLRPEQGARIKAINKSNFKCPDLIILEGRRGWKGLAIELKAKTIFKKDGSLLKNEHVEAQEKSIFGLVDKGYFAQFAVGFDEAKRIIDWYLKGEKQ
jgi:hypothetical protein